MQNLKPKNNETSIEITLDEFESLLSEKQRDKLMNMQNFLTLSYEKMYSYPKSIPANSS